MQLKFKAGIIACCLAPLAAAGQHRDTGGIHHRPRPKVRTKPVKVQFGVASYYADKFEGRKTYTDEIFSQKKLTAASNTLPMHTWVRVTNLRNHRTVVLRINDKMHPRNKRLIDLSFAAAEKLGFAGKGLTRGRVDVLGRKKPRSKGMAAAREE
ncbi:MAG: septal ring lytic transglycosylase RlpA family protein [Bacteroidota bacterium]|nr:septal ring lytic transglycosylase RlpA family protein [Bacteroidota bacterium]